jgi:hypothetical protein
LEGRRREGASLMNWGGLLNRITERIVNNLRGEAANWKEQLMIRTKEADNITINL